MPNIVYKQYFTVEILYTLKLTTIVIRYNVQLLFALTPTSVMKETVLWNISKRKKQLF